MVSILKIILIRWRVNSIAVCVDIERLLAIIPIEQQMSVCRFQVKRIAKTPTKRNDQWGIGRTGASPRFQKSRYEYIVRVLEERRRIDLIQFTRLHQRHLISALEVLLYCQDQVNRPKLCIRIIVPRGISVKTWLVSLFCNFRDLGPFA